jgi:CRP-like cAMP-binding protein
MADPSGPVTNRIEREIFLRAFVRGTSPPETVVQQFVDSLVERRVPRGAVLFRAGEPGDHVHYLVSGQVELRDPSGRAAPWSFGPRSAIGGIDVAQGQPYSRTAVAVEDTLLFRIHGDDYFEILEDNFEFAKSLIGFLFRGLEELARELPPELVYPEATPPDELAGLAGRRGLGLVERVLVLRAAAPLASIRLQVLVRLAQEARERRLAAGEALFEAGHGTGALWLVAHGCVVGERRDPPITARFGPGEMVLPHAAIGGIEASYRASAAAPSVVLALGREELWDVMEDHAEVGRALLAHAARERSRLQTFAVDRAAAAAGAAAGAAPR